MSPSAPSITIPVANAFVWRDENNNLDHQVMELENGWIAQLTSFRSQNKEKEEKKGVSMHRTLADARQRLQMEPNETLTPAPELRDATNKKGGFTVGLEAPRDAVKRIIMIAGLAARNAIGDSLSFTPGAGALIPMCDALDKLGGLATTVIAEGMDAVESTGRANAAAHYNVYRCIFEHQFRRVCSEAGERSFTVKSIKGDGNGDSQEKRS